ncbi:MAG: hypothetical protein IKM43_02190 [Clostridia bacterium]|nr:hypothetical protein [Clostridia bacterium]
MCEKEKIYGQILPNYYFIIKILQDLGITKKYMGFYYLAEILNLLINEDLKIRSFSRQVYPMLASKYNKNSCTIERDIRNVISRFWDEQLKNKLKLFWDREDTPSCCEFIYILKNYLVMQIA